LLGQRVLADDALLFLCKVTTRATTQLPNCNQSQTQPKYNCGSIMALDIPSQKIERKQ